MTDPTPCWQSQQTLFSTDTVIVEQIPAAAPGLLRLAIGFAGRLAVDAGATVCTQAASFAGETDEMREFLLYRKLLEPPEGCDPFVLRAAPLAGNEKIHGVVVNALPDDPKAGSNAVWPVSELSIQAWSGLCDLIGDPAREPLKLAGNPAAFATGYAAYAALCGLVIKNQRFGQRDTAIVDPLSVMSWINWKSVLLGGNGRRLTREGDLAEWPVMACADGHVAMVFTESDWPTLVQVIGNEKLKDGRFASFDGRLRYRGEYQQLIADWVAVHTKSQLSDLFRDARLPSGIIATVDDLLTDSLLEHRQAFFRYLADDGSDTIRPIAPHRKIVAGKEAGRSLRHPRSDVGKSDQKSLPLVGIRILDMGIITAGAGTTALLADMGADVYKIESATHPDPFRRYAGDATDGSPRFRYTNRNKRGLDIDLKNPAGRAQFLELVGNCDVVLENFRRGVMARLGIVFEQLSEANPNIILASLTAQGLSGPGSENASFGSAIEARSGIASMTGYPGEGPVISGRNLNYPDQIACLYGAATVTAALCWKRANANAQGRALHLDISQRDLAVLTLGDQIIRVSKHLGQAPKPVSGDAAKHVIEAVCKSADNYWLAVSIGSQVQATCQSNLGIASSDQLADWIAQRDAPDAVNALRAHGVACSRVLDGCQVFQDQQVVAGPAIGRTPGKDFAKGFPFQYQQVPMRINRDAPSIGQHNKEILVEILNASK